MNNKLLITIPLWGLVIFGLVSITKVSIDNLSGNACPDLFSIPICYIVNIGYALMLGSLIINNNKCKHHFFGAGWGIAFVIALFASLAEFFSGGGVCPSSSGGLRGSDTSSIPLCYISLAILVVILVLFIFGPYKQACEIHNNKVTG